MAYPEKNAHYRNKPAWMDRAVASEKRAQGGPIEIGNHSVGNGAGVSDIAEAATEDARDDLTGAMRNRSFEIGHAQGDYKPGGKRGPTRSNLEGKNYMDRGLGVDRADKWRKENGGYADGGVASKYPNKISGLTDEQIDANEARRPPNYDASTQMSKPDDTLGTGDHMMAQPKRGSDIDPNFTVKPKMDTGDRMEGKRIGKGIGQTLGWKRGGSV